MSDMSDNDVLYLLNTPQELFEKLNIWDLTQHIWLQTTNEIQWNEEEDIYNLFNGDGKTYSIELQRGNTITESFILYYNCDVGDGRRASIILSKSKRICPLEG